MDDLLVLALCAPMAHARIVQFLSVGTLRKEFLRLWATVPGRRIIPMVDQASRPPQNY